MLLELYKSSPSVFITFKAVVVFVVAIVAVVVVGDFVVVSAIVVVGDFVVVSAIVVVGAVVVSNGRVIVTKRLVFRWRHGGPGWCVEVAMFAVVAVPAVLLL